MQTSKSYQLQLYLQAQLLNLKKWTKLGNIQTNAYNLLQMSSTAALCLLVFLSHSLFVDYCNKQQLCLCLEGSHVNHISTHTVFSVVYLGLFQGLGLILGSLGAWGIWALKEVSDDDLTHCKTNDNKKHTHFVVCFSTWRGQCRATEAVSFTDDADTRKAQQAEHLRCCSSH